MGEGREDFAGDFFGGRREGTTECGVKGALSGSRIFYALFFARAAVDNYLNLLIPSDLNPYTPGILCVSNPEPHATVATDRHVFFNYIRTFPPLKSFASFA
jgi:hypothetical protein